MVELIVVLLLLLTVVTPILYFAGARRRTRKVEREIEKARHQAEVQAAENQGTDQTDEPQGIRRMVSFKDGKFDYKDLDHNRDDEEKHDHDPRNMFK